MVKGKKSNKQSENKTSSKKRINNSKSKSKENDSFTDEAYNYSQKNNETNNNFTITVYKLNNGLYSLNKDLTPKISITNFSSYLNQNIIPSDNSYIKIKIPIMKFKENKDNHPINYSLNFKNKNFESKLRAKTEKSYRNSKNMKNLGKEGKDAISYKIYCDIEAGPSILPKKKYCDFTGLTSNYNELHTGIRYYNSQIYKMSQNIAQPIKDQYLNIRKALIRLK